MSNNTSDQDKLFFKSFGIIMVVLGGIAVLALVVAAILGGLNKSDEPSPEQIALMKKRTSPTYQVVTVADAGEAEAAADAGGAEEGGEAKSGEEVYSTVCMACHDTGAAGAPKITETDIWSERLADEGKDTLYTHAIEGFNAMPPRGGDSSLSDEEVKNAVDYILSEAGVE